MTTTSCASSDMQTHFHPSMDDKAFVDFLFTKLCGHVDLEEIDLDDDDSCCDHLAFRQLDLDLDL